MGGKHLGRSFTLDRAFVQRQKRGAKGVSRCPAVASQNVTDRGLFGVALLGDLHLREARFLKLCDEVLPVHAIMITEVRYVHKRLYVTCLT